MIFLLVNNADILKVLGKNIKKVRVYFDEVIDNILTKIYNSQLEDVESNALDISRFFNKRDIATFHTTLKESIVIDCRLQNDIVINEAAKKLLNDDKLKILTDVLCQSKYHDYIEIDKDIFDKESVLTVDDIIKLIEKTNSFNLPVNIKTALKFRKLKQYKATGIYFSFSKQLGLDFRDGFGAYMHEVAHHIDLTIHVVFQSVYASLQKSIGWLNRYSLCLYVSIWPARFQLVEPAPVYVAVQAFFAVNAGFCHSTADSAFQYAVKADYVG